jgi:hypothetical protein
MTLATSATGIRIGLEHEVDLKCVHANFIDGNWSRRLANANSNLAKPQPLAASGLGSRRNGRMAVVLDESGVSMNAVSVRS